MKNLTENLKVWRKDRNITKADYLTFVGNVLEELLEPLYGKKGIENIKEDFIERWIHKEECEDYSDIRFIIDILDTIQDIQVFCINETELMGYDNIKCNEEVFKHINCRKQDPSQKIEWQQFGANGKWQKDKNQNPNEIYQPNYEKCRIQEEIKTDKNIPDFFNCNEVV